MKKFLGLRGQALNLAVGTIAGTDFLLFGYGKIVVPASYISEPLLTHHVQTRELRAVF
jgi:hypothetical protein